MNSCGIVGYGSFGVLLETLVRRFAPGVQIKIYSSRFAPDGTKFFALEDVARCDAVILAVPTGAFEDWVINIVPLLAPQTVIVDVATVKMHTVEVLKRRAPSCHWVATHPMFGPESYEKKAGDVSNFRVVIAESTISTHQKEQLVAVLKKCGFDVVELSPEAHDRHLAETLFLTHFVGQIISRASFARSEIDTVSFGYLMDAVESVKKDTKLFQDVFRFNPFCEKVLKRFEDSEKEVHELLRNKLS